MYLTTGNTIEAIAGTSSVITYTINGKSLGSTSIQQILAFGQLTTSSATIFTATENTTDVVTIILANTSPTTVSGIVISINGNQIIGELVIPANGTAIFVQGKWSIMDSNGSSPSPYPTETIYIVNIDTSIPNITYIGKAVIGSINSDPVWQIKQIDETTPIVTILFAEGDEHFDNIWDDRLSYIYS
jgi:hypothetical protein